ncbi:MAG: PmoA family protein [Pirellulales bacterium]
MKRSRLAGLFVLGCVLLYPANLRAEVTVEPSERGQVVKIDGKTFAEYLTKSGRSPALWPIIGPTGKPMTREYPAGTNDPGATNDHPHHHSVWFTHDEVSTPKVPRADFWSTNRNDNDDPKSPHVDHREFVKADSDGKVATIVTRNDWMNGDERMFEDERTLRFGQRANGDRWIDFAITIKATDGDVTFGDTKEGTFAVRVPDTMRVEAKKGGRFVNDQGLENEAAWGIPAPWVDYTGPVEGETLGIAFFSHPQSFRPNTRWHVRTYGLFAANPFGQKDFPKKEFSKQGAYTIKKGDELTLRYRVLLHRGTTEEADIDAAYQEFAALP